MSNANLTKHDGRVHYLRIKLFDYILPTIKSLNHNTDFEPALKNTSLTHTFSVDDFTSTENL
jgi:hypothetical protein